MAEVPDTVDDAIDALSETPTTDEVFLGTRSFSAREVASAAVASAAAGGGGGGSSAFTGFQVYRSTAWNADGGNIPYDGVAFDSDSYWNAVAKQAVIPAGKAGLYAITVVTFPNDVATLDGVTAAISTGTPDTWESGVLYSFTKRLDQNGNVDWSGMVTIYGRYDVGDLIAVPIGWHPFTVATISIGAGSYLVAQLVGVPA